MSSPIYLDYNATAPVRPEVLAAMHEILQQPANPSSVHRFGREAKKHLENARKTIADAVSAFVNEVILTASATEANALALRGFPGRRVLVSAVEHSSVLKVTGSRKQDTENASSPVTCNLLPVTSFGVVDLNALRLMLSENTQPALVSVMLANNETGVIQPIAELAAICKKYDALLHCDAVQGLGKIPVDFGLLGCDMMTISPHKCGGPVGAAALVIKQNLAIASLLTGGGQELGRRAGTENLAAIIGFARSVQLTDLSHMKRLRGWLDAMETAVASQGGIVFGKAVSRLPNTSCIAMPGVSSEVQLMNFDLQNIAISAGSACSSGRIEVSHVLAAMCIDKGLAGSAIRVSGGWQTTQEHVKIFSENWQNTYARLGKADIRISSANS
jgi:cysteine desulfurase